MNVCFFCASSLWLEQKYYDLANEFAKELVQRNWTLVTGGSAVGLMNVLIKTVKNLGGNSLGVIPGYFFEKGVASFDNSKIILTKDLGERKKIIIENSDAFIILPGGFGTLDELFEVVTMKQLGEINCPIVIFNFEKFYNPILEQFEKLYAQNFSKEHNRMSYFVSEDINETLQYIADYKPAEVKSYRDLSKKVFA